MKKILSIIIGVMIIGIVLSAYLYKENTEYSSSENTSKIIIEQNHDVQIHETEEELTKSEKESILSVQNFKGNDNEGKSVAELLRDIVTSKYSKSVITDSSTKIVWNAFTDSKRPNSHGVVFTFNSTDNEFSFLWYVDDKTGAILPVGTGTENLMKLLN